MSKSPRKDSASFTLLCSSGASSTLTLTLWVLPISYWSQRLLGPGGGHLGQDVVQQSWWPQDGGQKPSSGFQSPHHHHTAVPLAAGGLHPFPGGLACSFMTGPRTHAGAAPTAGNLPWQPHLLDYSSKTAPLEPAWEGARDPRPKTCPGSDWLAGYLPPPGRAKWECWVAPGRSPELLGLSEPICGPWGAMEVIREPALPVVHI